MPVIKDPLNLIGRETVRYNLMQKQTQLISAPSPPSHSHLKLGHQKAHFGDTDENPNPPLVCPIFPALTSLTQFLTSVPWWAFGKVSSSSSRTASSSQQPRFISVTSMSATPPEPARISHGVELPIPLCILCKQEHTHTALTNRRTSPASTNKGSYRSGGAA